MKMQEEFKVTAVSMFQELLSCSSSWVCCLYALTMYQIYANLLLLQLVLTIISLFALMLSCYIAAERTPMSVQQMFILYCCLTLIPLSLYTFALGLYPSFAHECRTKLTLAYDKTKNAREQTLLFETSVAEEAQKKILHIQTAMAI